MNSAMDSCKGYLLLFIICNFYLSLTYKCLLNVLTVFVLNITEDLSKHCHDIQDLARENVLSKDRKNQTDDDIMIVHNSKIVRHRFTKVMGTKFRPIKSAPD